MKIRLCFAAGDIQRLLKQGLKLLCLTFVQALLEEVDGIRVPGGKLLLFLGILQQMDGGEVFVVQLVDHTVIHSAPPCLHA